MFDDGFAAAPGGGITAHGALAHRLLASGFSIKSFRTLDVLRKEEWKELDTVVVEEARQRLQVVADLQAAGLVHRLTNGMGTTVLEWETQSDMDAAELTMDGVTRPTNDAVEFTLKALPLPITHKQFYISLRKLMASRRLGDPLDVTQAQLSARLVAEKVEDTVINGATSILFGGGTLHGLRTEPNRNTGTFVGGGNNSWTNAAKTGEQILTDVLAMIDALRQDRYFGPYRLYIPGTYETKLDEDFKADSDKSIRTRLLEISNLAGISVLDAMPTDNAVVVSMQSDVIDLVEGLTPTTGQWDLEGGFRVAFKVFAIQVPRIKSSFEARSGIAHFTT